MASELCTIGSAVMEMTIIFQTVITSSKIYLWRWSDSLNNHQKFPKVGWDTQFFKIAQTFKKIFYLTSHQLSRLFATDVREVLNGHIYEIWKKLTTIK